MNCPICGKKTIVIDSRKQGPSWKRRRECERCLTRFNTFEKLDMYSFPDYLKNKIKYKSLNPRRHRPWTFKEREFLKENNDKMSDKQIAKKLKRTSSAVSNQKRVIGLTRKREGVGID